MILTHHHTEMLCLADDCLYFQINEVSYCLSPWSMGLELSLLVGDNWLPIRTDSEIQLLHHMSHRFLTNSYFEEIIGSIPKGIRTKAIRFHHLQHTILRLMRATRAAIDLADSNPILLWLIASKVASNKLTYQKAKPLLESKQKAILKRMYPGSNALSVSFIKKIQATRYNAKEFQLVSALVENDANINSLRHCTQVNLDILSYFITEDYALKVPLVKSLISGKGKDIDLCGEIQIKIHEAMDAAWGIGHGNPMEALQRCSSYDQICTLHIRWVERNIGSLVMFEDEEFSDVSHFGLHMPMAPGTPEIEAITSISGLFIEGEEMEHCVAYFADDVINGEATVYRVLSPQRGTLMLLRSSNRFVIDEFRLAGNEEPNHESWALVRRWEKLINS